MQRIHSVDTVTTHFSKSPNQRLGIAATGMVISSGWSDPHLVPRVYIAPPTDRFQDFDFFAQEPTGIVLPVLLPISAAQVTDKDPANYWGKGIALSGVRIHSQTNSVESKLESAAQLHTHNFAEEAATEEVSSTKSWLIEPTRSSNFSLFPLPDLTCLGCKANPLFWQAAAVVKLAKEAGLIKSKEDCKSILSNGERLAAILSQVLPGQGALVAAVVSFAVGACTDCLCDQVF